MQPLTIFANPPGHRRGCRCVICARRTRRNPGIVRRAVSGAKAGIYAGVASAARKRQERHAAAAFENPRRNPLEVSRVGRRQSGGFVLSRNVHVLCYTHAEDGKDYRHPFGPGVCVHLNTDGSITLYHKQGKPLWKNF